MNPVTTATSAVKSAFSLRAVLTWIALYFIFNLAVGAAAKFFPKQFGPVYRFITNPFSFFTAQNE